jgi:hypothetical protein
MGGARVVALVAAVALGAMAACSSFSSSSEPPDGGAGEASTTDASVPPDAAIDVGSILSNSDLELGCAGWIANRATLAPITDPSLAHSGKQSCLVCTTADKAEVSQAKPVAAPRDAQFYAGAWLRKAPDGGPLSLTTHIDITTATGAGIQQGAFTSAPNLDESWQMTTALVDVTVSDGAGVNLYFTVAEQGRCFLVDDIWLYRMK